MLPAIPECSSRSHAGGRRRRRRPVAAASRRFRLSPHIVAWLQVNAHQGYDPLIQLPDGSERPVRPPLLNGTVAAACRQACVHLWCASHAVRPHALLRARAAPTGPQMDLGYERCPKLGPTTNFVGNHMTQGAIDLVQAQLEGAGVEGAAAAVEQGAGIGSSPSRSSALPTSVASLPPLLYRWRDEGSTVRIEVPLGRVLQRLGTSTAEGAPHLRCCFKADSLEVSMMALAGDDEESGAPPHRLLLLHPLPAAVVPQQCRCSFERLPALLPSGCHGSGGGSPEEAGSPPCFPGQCCLTIPLPPLTAEAADVALAVVELAKLDCQRHWAAVLASGGSSGSGSSCIEIATTPDLTTLR